LRLIPRFFHMYLRPRFSTEKGGPVKITYIHCARETCVPDIDIRYEVCCLHNVLESWAWRWTASTFSLSLVAFCTDVSYGQLVSVSSYTVVFIYESWSYLNLQRFLALIAILCWCAVKQSINQHIVLVIAPALQYWRYYYIILTFLYYHSTVRKSWKFCILIMQCTWHLAYIVNTFCTWYNTGTAVVRAKCLQHCVNSATKSVRCLHMRLLFTTFPRFSAVCAGGMIRVWEIRKKVCWPNDNGR